MASPRGDAADCWRLLLLGEILRALGGEARVRDEPVAALGRSGRWQAGLARLGPALDDALGATAFAVAWRWACAQLGRRAWPGAALVAHKAQDRAAAVGGLAPGELARTARRGEAIAVFDDGRAALDRCWTLRCEDGTVARVGVRGAPAQDWREVDRIADIAAAWLGGEWSVG